jgi:transcriptional regulatory protein LevR
LTKRIYWADIIECEDQLFENLDALIAVGTETPECFMSWGSDDELVSVDTNDEMELVITYTTIDDYDENGEEIRKTVTETFSYNYAKELAVLV